MFSCSHVYDCGFVCMDGWMDGEKPNIIHTYLYAYVGSIVPFSNPSGVLIFGEDSVQRINLTLINNGTVEVHMYVCT